MPKPRKKKPMRQPQSKPAAPARRSMRAYVATRRVTQGY